MAARPLLGDGVAATDVYLGRPAANLFAELYRYAVSWRNSRLRAQCRDVSFLFFTGPSY